MKTKYQEYIPIFKALSDANRLMIVDMLSCGELCTCELLEKFDITQPTLSHHMKILSDCGLIIGRKEGKWTKYSLNLRTVNQFEDFVKTVTTDTEECICKQ